MHLTIRCKISLITTCWANVLVILIFNKDVELSNINQYNMALDINTSMTNVKKFYGLKDDSFSATVLYFLFIKYECGQEIMGKCLLGINLEAYHTKIGKM